MGWTFTHKDKFTNVKSFFERQFTSSQILDCKVKNKVAYIACKRDEKVFAVVCLLNYRPKDYYNFGYKDMDETMHPYYYDCPTSILDKLTATDNRHSLEWRENCYKNMLKNEETKSLKVGDIIKFDREFSFKKTLKTNLFEVIDVKKGHYYAYKLGFTVKLTKSTMNNNTWSKI